MTEKVAKKYKRRNSRTEKTRHFLPINTYETGNMLEKEGQINPKN